MKEDILVQSVNEAVKENPSIRIDFKALIEKTHEKFVQKKLDDFPRMCQETRRVNVLKKKMLHDIDNSGGWSEKKDFKYMYDIPRDLYDFMQNLVYKKFWSDDNEKVWRSFMKAIMRGDDAMGLLMKTKTLYGPNNDPSLTT